MTRGKRDGLGSRSGSGRRCIAKRRKGRLEHIMMRGSLDLLGPSSIIPLIFCNFQFHCVRANFRMVAMRRHE
jgi:hypothetical protein